MVEMGGGTQYGPSKKTTGKNEKKKSTKKHKKTVLIGFWEYAVLKICPSQLKAEQKAICGPAGHTFARPT